VNSLNELEYVNGEIYANVWPTSLIARISPDTGEVTGIIDLRGLLPGYEQEQIGWSEIAGLHGNTSIPFNEEPCLNGIAYDPAGDRLYVTGKLWPELFEIRVVKV
jgi:glutamine cyclotransferase